MGCTKSKLYKQFDDTVNYDNNTAKKIVNHIYSEKQLCVFYYTIKYNNRQNLIIVKRGFLDILQSKIEKRSILPEKQTCILIDEIPSISDKKLCTIQLNKDCDNEIHFKIVLTNKPLPYNTNTYYSTFISF